MNTEVVKSFSLMEEPAVNGAAFVQDESAGSGSDVRTTERPLEVDQGGAWTVGEAFATMLRHPWHCFVEQWNWKSALTSALIRGLMFFATNITAGFQAASWALLLQFAYRAATSGFWGSFTQAMRFARPRWLAGLVVGVGLSVFAHALELLVHWAGGTAELKRSIMVSVGFTVISNLFNLYIMQHNALVVGAGEQSFAKDMARMPRLIAGFLAWPVTAMLRRRIQP